MAHVCRNIINIMEGYPLKPPESLNIQEVIFGLQLISINREPVGGIREQTADQLLSKDYQMDI